MAHEALPMRSASTALTNLSVVLVAAMLSSACTDKAEVEADPSCPEAESYGVPCAVAQALERVEADAWTAPPRLWLAARQDREEFLGLVNDPQKARERSFVWLKGLGNDSGATRDPLSWSSAVSTFSGYEGTILADWYTNDFAAALAVSSGGTQNFVPASAAPITTVAADSAFAQLELVGCDSKDVSAWLGLWCGGIDVADIQQDPISTTAVLVPSVDRCQHPDAPRSIQRVVLHSTESGTFFWSLSTLRSSCSTSAHYLVGREFLGSKFRAVQLVREADIAYHAGNFCYNQESIGIEQVGEANDSKSWADDGLYDFVAALILDIRKRSGSLVIDRDHVVLHSEVPDPNRYPATGAPCAPPCALAYDACVQGDYGGSKGHTDPGRYYDICHVMSAANGRCRCVDAVDGNLEPSCASPSGGSAGDTGVIGIAGSRGVTTGTGGQLNMGIGGMGGTSATSAGGMVSVRGTGGVGGISGTAIGGAVSVTGAGGTGGTSATGVGGTVSSGGGSGGSSGIGATSSASGAGGPSGIGGSAGTLPEQCDGKDNDGDLVIDDLETCWTPVYRFWDEGMDITRRSRCYATTSTPPADCLGYAREWNTGTFATYGAVFFLYSVGVPGTVELIPFDNGQDHILVRGDDSTGQLLLAKAGYIKRPALGWMWADVVSSPVGSTTQAYYQPPAANTAQVRPLRRYSLADPGIHLYVTNPEEPPVNSGWAPEGWDGSFDTVGFVWGSRW